MFRLLLTALITMTPLVAQAAPHASQRVAAGRIVAAARARIEVQLGAAAATAKVVVVGKPEDVNVPAGTVTLDARGVSGRWPRARVGVPVVIRVNGRVARSATVWFALEVHRAAFGYAFDAARGALAVSLKLVSHDADVAAVQGTLVDDLREVRNMRLRHPVQAGSIAVREDFEQVPDVDRQGRVRVLVTSGSIHMQARGTALAKGYAGDLVPVLVDNAEAPVRARITSKGVVQVVQ